MSQPGNLSFKPDTIGKDMITSPIPDGLITVILGSLSQGILWRLDVALFSSIKEAK